MLIHQGRLPGGGGFRDGGLGGGFGLSAISNRGPWDALHKTSRERGSGTLGLRSGVP